MRTIIMVLCLAGSAAWACGPATPEPVTGGTEGEPEPGVPERGAGELQGGSGAQMPINAQVFDGPATPDDTPAGPDRDLDGILDPNDQCPDEPEDRDGFQDEDGCPDPDNDQDGLSDVQDLCPNEPEDRDGFQDEDGCPDP